jgi:type I restriction enzyme S subunit
MSSLPNNWQVKSLGEIVKISKGKKLNSLVENKTPSSKRFIQIDDLRNSDCLKYTEDKSGVLVNKKDVLIAWDGANAGTIGFGLDGFIGSTIARLEILDDSVFTNYFGLYLRTKSKYLRDNSTGATIPHINKSVLESLKIPLPPLPIQKQIAEILEQADKAKQKRKEANKLTDEFLQSVFIEMFGDPIKNPKGWEVKELNDLAVIERESVTSQNFFKSDLYIGLEHIEKDSGKLLGYEPVENIVLKSSKFRFTSDHILYGKLRPYLNKVCLPNFNGVCSTDIIPIKPRQNISNKYFLAYLVRMDFFVKEANTKSTGANLPRISPNLLGKIKLFSPPLSLQQQFADIVNNTEALKEKQKQSEQELENLFQVLMQKAFKGELVS